MNAPAMSRRGPRTSYVLAGVLLVGVLLAVVGIVFDLPWGLGGVELALVATPVVLAVLALIVVLRTADGRARRDR